MKLVTCSNHSWPHTGGTETVIQEISEGLTRQFDYDCHIVSRSVKQKFVEHNKIKIHRCESNADSFIKQIESLNPDCLFIYSDCFAYWPDIIDHSISNVAISLVGMNLMMSKRHIFSKFRKKYRQFKVITHSNNYQDYITCEEIGIPVTVIPNGVKLQDFSDEKLSGVFRKKYNITTKYIILCVSNFFPGKGQEYLVAVLDQLYKKITDFTVVFICSSVNFFPANNIRDRIRTVIKKKKFTFKFLCDIPRKDVELAFIDADIFAFPSQKEVAPIVILEAMASKTPWIAFPVGNVPLLEGGFMVPYRAKDKRGFTMFGKETHDCFVQHLYNLLTDEEMRISKGIAGQEMIKESFSWDYIVPKYHKLFSENK